MPLGIWIKLWLVWSFIQRASELKKLVVRQRNLDNWADLFEALLSELGISQQFLI